MRRSLTIIATAALCLCLLTPAVGAQTLQVYGIGVAVMQTALNEYVIPEFTKKYPGVNVEIIDGGGDAQKLKVLIAGGLAPDVAVLTPREFPEFARTQFEALEPYIEKSRFRMANIPEGASAQFVLDGKLYGLPFSGLGFNVHALYVNRDLFREMGVVIPPVDYENQNSGWTYDQFRSATKKLTKDVNGDGKNDTWGFAPAPSTLGNWFRLIWNFGGDILTEQPSWHSTVNSPEAVEAIEFMRNLKFVDQVVGPNNAFPTGKMGVIESPFMYSANQMAKVSFDWSLAAHPRGKGGRWNLALNNPMSIMSTSKNKELAFAFMQHWLSDEVQSYLSKLNLVPPQTYSVARNRSFVFTSTPPYDKSAFFFGKSKAMPLAAPNWPEVMTLLSTEFNAAWASSDVPTRNILQNLHEKINALMK